jgi:Family of unknown function (DUF6459)
MPTQQVLLSHADVTNDAAPFTESRSGKAPGGGESAGRGLPALRLVPVPDTDPPFDGDPPTGAPAPGALWASGRGLGQLAQTARGHADGWVGGGGVLGSPRADAEAPAGTRAATAVPAGPQAGAEASAGAAGDDWSRQFALLLTEALAGARPLRQILPWTTDRARAHLDKLMPLFSGGQRPRVRRVITSRPTRDAIEMTVVVGVGTRTRALAVRLERVLHPQGGVSHSGGTRSRLPGPAVPPARAERTPPQWLCTAIEAA